MSRRTVAIVLVLAVALAAVGLLVAGFGPGDGTLSDGADTDDPTTGESSLDGSSDGGDGDATEDGTDRKSTDADGSDADGGSEDGESTENGDTEGTSQDENADGDADSETDDSGDSAEGSDTGSEAEAVETADVPVEIYAADRGPVEEGEMRLYNTTSGAHVATHDFADGHETVFENLTRTTTFDIVVNVSYYPDETVTFNPRISEAVNETIGYEFRGAETYEMEWEVDELPNNVDYDDEDAEEMAITQKGYSVFDGEGNYYSTWSPSMFDASYDYLHVAENNQSYMNAAVEDAEWRQIEAYWGDPSTSREQVTTKGLSVAKDREFIEEKDVISTERDKVHVYEVSEQPFDAPMTIHIDPNTGYVVYSKIHIKKLDDPNALRSVAEIYSHDEEVSAIPEDFPVEKVANKTD